MAASMPSTGLDLLNARQFFIFATIWSRCAVESLSHWPFVPPISTLPWSLMICMPFTFG